MPQVKPSGYDITPLGESLLARQKSNRDEQNTVNRNRRRRAERNTALVGIIGGIGNAVLQAQADKFMNTEASLNARLRNKRVLGAYQQDLELKEQLDKDPDYLKNQYMTRIMEEKGGEYQNMEPVATERLFAPLARAKADEDEKFLKERLVLGNNLHSMSDGEADFYERQRRKLRPATIKGWLGKILTGDKDRDSDTIVKLYDDRAKEYETLVSRGVSRERSQEILANLKHAEIPQDAQMKFMDYTTRDHWGTVTTEKVPYFVNKQGQLVAQAGPRTNGRPASASNTISDVPEIVDKNIPDEDVYQILARARKNVSHEDAVWVDKVLIEAKLPEGASREELLSIKRTQAGVLTRLDFGLEALGISDDNMREQLAAQIYVNNVKTMYADINDSFSITALTGVDTVYDGSKVNPIMALSAVDDMKRHEVNSSNKASLERLQSALMTSLESRGAAIRIKSTTDQETLENVFDAVVNKQAIFEEPFPYELEGTSNPDNDGKPYISSPTSTIGGYLRYKFLGEPPETTVEKVEVPVPVKTKKEVNDDVDGYFRVTPRSKGYIEMGLPDQPKLKQRTPGFSRGG